MCHPWCRTRIHFHPFACTWAFHLPSLSSLSSTSTSPGHVADQLPLRRSTEWGVWLCGQNNLFYRLWAQRDRQLRLLRDLYSDLPEWSRRRRHGTVVLVRCGTRRWDHRESALFTTVHPGARRISEPKTSLSLSWRKFDTSSVFFHTNKNGETRIRTKFKIVLKTEVKSRLGKRANQDSPWKRKKSKFLLKSELRSRSTNFKQILTKEVSRNSLELLTLSEWKLIILLQCVSNPGEINYYCKKKCQNKIGIFVKLVSGICETWKNCRKVTC